MKSSLSVIVCAFNEEKNLPAAVDSILAALDHKFGSYEILIFDDGSTDGTGRIADQLSHQNSNIKVIHHKENKGVGYTLREAIELASKDYIILFPGHNGIEEKSLAHTLDQIGKADIIVGYLANPEYRPVLRRTLSRLYTLILNFLFGLNFRYYNGLTLYPSKLLKPLAVSNPSYAFLAEVLIRLIKAGHTYVEVPTYHRKREHGSSKALQFKNVKSVFVTISKLFGEIYLEKEK